MKFHKTFGQIEILNETETHITILTEEGKERTMIKKFCKIWESEEDYLNSLTPDFDYMAFLKENRNAIIETIKDSFSKYSLNTDLKVVMQRVMNKVSEANNEDAAWDKIDVAIAENTDHDQFHADQRERIAAYL